MKPKRVAGYAILGTLAAGFFAALVVGYGILSAVAVVAGSLALTGLIALAVEWTMS